MDELEAIVDEQKPLMSLKKDLSEGGRLLQCDMGPFVASHEKQLSTLTKVFVAPLRDDISNRFDGY